MDPKANIDAFIGLDISVESTADNDDESRQPDFEQRKHSALGAVRPTRRKRSVPQSRSCSTDSKKRIIKPPPTPNPPRALVSLIRNDASVLHYFRALQANLDYDVDKWKNESKRWKSIAQATMDHHTVAETKFRASKRSSSNDKSKLEVEIKPPSPSTSKEKQSDTALDERLKQLSNDLPVESESKNDDGSTISITDEALFGGIDDDSSDNKSSDQSIHSNRSIDHGTNLDQCKVKRNILIINEQFKEAKKCLDMLGVSLVEIEIKSIVQSFDGEEDKTNETSRANENGVTFSEFSCPQLKNLVTTTKVVEKILHRQSDEKVLAEMMASLKTLIKASNYIGLSTTDKNIMTEESDQNSSNGLETDEYSSFEKSEGENALKSEERVFRGEMRRQYHPFCRDGSIHVPTSYFSNNVSQIGDRDTFLRQHPASIGLHHVIRILSIMDLYCRDDLDDIEWNKMFDIYDDGGTTDDLDIAILKVGLRNRSRIAERVLSSLYAEVTRTWALAERASCLAEPSVHFHPADIIDIENGESEQLKRIHKEPGSVYSAKSYNRLVKLEEQIAHARIVTLMYRRRNDWQKAIELVIGYIISSAPSVSVESHPKLPPSLSMCVLEALLSPENYVPMGTDQSRLNHIVNERNGWFLQSMNCLFSPNTQVNASSYQQTEEESVIMRALSCSVYAAFRIWEERSVCSDDRIRDIALIEVAAYRRLQKSADGFWLNNVCEETMLAAEEILETALPIVLPQASHTKHAKACNIITCEQLATSAICCNLSLLNMGNIDRIIKICEMALSTLRNSMKLNSNGKQSIKESANCLSILPLSSSAYASIMFRRWDSIKLENTTDRNTAAAYTIENRFLPILESAIALVSPSDYANIESLLQCCALLGDGHNLLRLAKNTLPKLIEFSLSETKIAANFQEKNIMLRTLATFIDIGEIPTVRVINLQRRPDRLLDFMSCASHKEQLIVMHGPIKLRRKSNICSQSGINITDNLPVINDSNTENYAFDGQGGHKELEKVVAKHLNRKGVLSDFVLATWRPGELRAFDKDACDTSELVNISPTEMACALSHIASWMDVENSLCEMSQSIVDKGLLYRSKVLRMLKISGFARGQALLQVNEGMIPNPVCVILEDDAVLCDRFSERLALLLEELPRDFHFCSLGYSRPKTAPIIEYSSQLGIPSCLWYLTGYILSLEGAKYLVECLPVSGPVDSWIGMKMCSNWDNIFGQWIGVGKHSRPQSKLPSRKDLGKIMRFRAFAAMVPLCAQKVGTKSSFAVSRGSWRDKDTDIVYSGKLS